MKIRTFALVLLGLTATSAGGFIDGYYCDSAAHYYALLISFPFTLMFVFMGPILILYRMKIGAKWHRALAHVGLAIILMIWFVPLDVRAFRLIGAHVRIMKEGEAFVIRLLDAADKIMIMKQEFPSRDYNIIGHSVPEFRRLGKLTCIEVSDDMVRIRSLQGISGSAWIILSEKLAERSERIGRRPEKSEFQVRRRILRTFR